jgi:membrane protein implicated in regulation of membrane protease activity
MNLLKSDELGVPSTFLAMFANVTAMAGLQFVNVVFTSVISILSIVYLGYKIRHEIKRNQDNGEG